MSIGAHIHHINIFAAESSAVEDLALVQFVTPAVTPVYSNNPGLGLLEINDETLKVERFVFRFFLLEDYHRFDSLISWAPLYDPAGFHGIDVNEPLDVRAF